ncbi:MAG: hypothetical protein ABGX63_05800 [bacterium]
MELAPAAPTESLPDMSQFEVVGGAHPAPGPAPVAEPDTPRGPPTDEEMAKFLPGAEPEQDAGPDMSGFEVVGGSGSRQDGVDFAAGAEQTAKSMVTGMTKGAATLAGTAAGVKAGLVAAPFMGPFAPAGPLLGGLAGTAIGYLFGDYAADQAAEAGIASLPPEQVPADMRPFAYFGESFSGSLAATGATLTVAKAGVRMASGSWYGNLVNNLLNAAKDRTKRFLWFEGAAATRSAAAAAGAEVVVPGEAGVRIGAELTLGVIDPIKIATGSFKLGRHVFRSTVAALSKETRMTEVSKTIDRVLEEAGDDTELAFKLFTNAEMFKDIPMTFAARTGMPGAAALEARVGALLGSFSEKAAAMHKAALGSLEIMIKGLRGEGTPQAMKAAAELQGSRFKLILEGRVSAAKMELEAAVAKIDIEGPNAKEEIGILTRDIMKKTIADLRTVEETLWGRINQGTEVEVDVIADVITGLKDKMEPVEKLPEIVEDFLRRVTSREKKIAEGMMDELTKDEVFTVKNLLRLRSQALKKMRMLSTGPQPDFEQAKMLGETAEAVLEALDRMPNTATVGVYNEARKFSKELNDVFSRTFAGQSHAKGGRGGRMPPELMGEMAWATGGIKGSLQMEEMWKAAQMADRAIRSADPLAPIDTQMADEMIQAQERLIRFAAAESLDPLTREPNAVRLAKFIRKNSRMWKLFPNVLKDLEAALKSTAKLKDVARTTSHASRMVEKKTLFAKLADVEDSVDAVAAAVTGGKPTQQLTQLIKLALRTEGDDAMEGLVGSVIDYAMMQATKGQGFSWLNFQAALFKKFRPSPDSDSMIDVMVREGGMTQDLADRLTEVVEQAAKIEVARNTTSRAAADFPMAATIFEDFVWRITGSRGASEAVKRFGGGIAASGLIIARAGSAMMHRIFGKVPKEKTLELLSDGLTDPVFYKMLKEVPKTPRQALALKLRMHSYLFSAGLMEVGNQEIGDEDLPFAAKP